MERARLPYLYFNGALKLLQSKYCELLYVFCGTCATMVDG